MDDRAFEAARANLAPSMVQVRCSADGGGRVAAVSLFEHETHRVDFDRGGDYTAGEAREAVTLADGANAITSKITGGPLAGWHTVALDLDVPARLVPSSTSGHSHLYIDAPMTWDLYRRLLEVLADAGVIEDGFARASIDREYTSLRLPWVRKDSDG